MSLAVDLIGERTQDVIGGWSVIKALMLSAVKTVKSVWDISIHLL